MRTKRNQRGVRKARVPFTLSMRKAVTQHFRKHLAVYVPALLPTAFVLFAHFITLLTLIFIKSGLLGHEQLIHKTVVTWAVYGFLPLVLCSYCCFFAVARPVTGILERAFPLWSATMLTLLSGAAYGAAMGAFLLLLLAPATVLNAVFLLLLGMVAGQGNWFFYRKLTVVDA